MYKIRAIVFLFLALACSKDDEPERFKSINGTWIVRTPDSQTTLSFRVSQDQDNINVIDRTSVVHNGTDFNSKTIYANMITINEREIESLTFTNNSFEQPFLVIRLTNASVNEDFTEMQIENSSFNINGEFREFPMITAGRN
ncbi:MAG TPA: hypothetical protein VFT90_00460 [Chryseosolibacter sp.]|nr:hypothetical protein [Chryseosolibacter sp.]